MPDATHNRTSYSEQTPRHQTSVATADPWVRAIDARTGWRWKHEIRNQDGRQAGLPPPA
eukprot:CAMPEP_0118813428 /NCGR_PEP_ID=MMETSP1162-20130426/2933_1 /TAXON_ID=33656 /ORGANISM="Phaeocystis Sp, Strain CCMP2710" /LENGTH=58 /DNA_ID=CAMNT_0006743221 /DNA_START=63 /DNA_END=236 /DNA_ORIENTATION=+